MRFYHGKAQNEYRCLTRSLVLIPELVCIVATAVLLAYAFANSI